MHFIDRQGQLVDAVNTAFALEQVGNTIAVAVAAVQQTIQQPGCLIDEGPRLFDRIGGKDFQYQVDGLVRDGQAVAAVRNHLLRVKQLIAGQADIARQLFHNRNRCLQVPTHADVVAGVLDLAVAVEVTIMDAVGAVENIDHMFGVAACLAEIAGGQAVCRKLAMLLCHQGLLLGAEHGAFAGSALSRQQIHNPATGINQQIAAIHQRPARRRGHFLSALQADHQAIIFSEQALGMTPAQDGMMIKQRHIAQPQHICPVVADQPGIIAKARRRRINPAELQHIVTGSRITIIGEAQHTSPPGDRFSHGRRCRQIAILRQQWDRRHGQGMLVGRQNMFAALISINQAVQLCLQFAHQRLRNTDFIGGQDALRSSEGRIQPINRLVERAERTLGVIPTLFRHFGLGQRRPDRFAAGQQVAPHPEAVAGVLGLAIAIEIAEHQAVFAIQNIDHVFSMAFCLGQIGDGQRLQRKTDMILGHPRLFQAADQQRATLGCRNQQLAQFLAVALRQLTEITDPAAGNHRRHIFRLDADDHLAIGTDQRILQTAAGLDHAALDSQWPGIACAARRAAKPEKVACTGRRLRHPFEKQRKLAGHQRRIIGKLHAAKLVCRRRNFR